MIWHEQKSAHHLHWPWLITADLWPVTRWTTEHKDWGTQLKCCLCIVVQPYENMLEQNMWLLSAGFIFLHFCLWFLCLNADICHIGHQRSQTNEGVPVGTSSASGSTKPPVTGSRLPQASGHTLAVGSSQLSTAVSSSRLPYKSHGVPKSIPSKASVHNEHSGSTGNAQGEKLN